MTRNTRSGWHVWHGRPLLHGSGEARHPRLGDRVARRGTTVQGVHSSPREGAMSAMKRESWGSLRKLPSGRC